MSIALLFGLLAQAATLMERYVVFNDFSIFPVHYLVSIIDPISFMIIGSKGKGQKRVITLKGFQPSSSVTKLLTSSDIGVPVGFQVDLEENGKWRLVYVKIQNMSMF